LSVTRFGRGVESGEKAESGNTTGRSLNVVAFKQSTLGSEFIDVRATDVFLTVASKLGIQIINTYEENVRSLSL